MIILLAGFLIENHCYYQRYAKFMHSVRELDSFFISAKLNGTELVIFLNAKNLNWAELRFLPNELELNWALIFFRWTSELNFDFCRMNLNFTELWFFHINLWTELNLNLWFFWIKKKKNLNCTELQFLSNELELD